MGDMSGTSDSMKIQQAPLMSDFQRQFLDQALGGMASQMQGYNFGMPYTGPSLKNYNPRTFNFANYTPKYTDVWPSTKDSLKQPTPKPTPTPAPKPTPKPTPTPTPTPGPGPAPTPPGPIPGPRPKITMADLLAMIPILGPNTGTPPNPQLQTPTGAMTKALTSPFTSPFTYGMTGNYPKSRSW